MGCAPGRVLNGPECLEDLVRFVRICPPAESARAASGGRQFRYRRCSARHWNWSRTRRRATSRPCAGRKLSPSACRLATRRG